MSHTANRDLGKITEDELKGIRRSIKGRNLLNCAKNIAEQAQFDIGDVLVARYMGPSESGGTRYETMSSSNVKQKYLVVYKDSAQLIYCKKIREGGQLSKAVDMIATRMADTVKFELDPDMAESILLDQESNYDAMATAKELKRKKEAIKKHNKKIRIGFETLKEANDFLATLKVGQKVWQAYHYTDMNPSEHTVTSVENKPLDLKVPSYSYSRNAEPADKKYADAGLQSKTVVKIRRANSNYDSDFICDRLVGTHYNLYYLEKPKVLDETI